MFFAESQYEFNEQGRKQDSQEYPPEFDQSGIAHSSSSVNPAVMNSYNNQRSSTKSIESALEEIKFDLDDFPTVDLGTTTNNNRPDKINRQLSTIKEEDGYKPDDMESSRNMHESLVSFFFKFFLLNIESNLY